MNAASNFFPEFRRVLSTVNGNGMLHGGIDKLVGRIGAYGNRAAAFTREFTAIYIQASHGFLPAPLPRIFKSRQFGFR